MRALPEEMVSVADTRRFAGRMACTCAGVSALMSCVVMAGWIFHCRILISFMPGLVPMEFSLAFGAVVVSVSLLLAAMERRHRRSGLYRALKYGSVALACVALLVAGYSLLESFTRMGLGIDRGLWPDTFDDAGRLPIRPSPAGAIAVGLAGMALLAWRRPGGLALYSGCIVALICLAWLSVAALVYGAFDREPAVFRSVLPMPAAAAFVSAATGFVFLRPFEGMLRLFSSPWRAGSLARRLVPAGAFLTVALGFGTLWAQRRWGLGPALGLAGYGTGVFVSLAALSLRGVMALDRLDRRHRRAEREVQRALVRAQAFYEFAPGGMVVMDSAGRIQTVNSEIERLFGYERSELIDYPIGHLLPGVQMLQAVVNVPAQHRSGSRFAVEVRFNPLATSGGRFVIASIRDVSKQEAALQALRERESLLAEAQRLAHLGSWSRNLTTGLETWSDELYRILGYAPQRVPADQALIRGALHPEDKAAGIAMMGTAPDQPEYRDVKCRILRGTNEVRYLRCSATVLRDSFGTPVSLLGIMLDVTEQEMVARALEESEERFRSAIEHSAIGMAILALDGRFLKVNRALCELVGRGEQQMLAMTFQGITHPDDLEASLTQMQALLVGEASCCQLDKRYLHQNGRIVWVMVTCTVIRNSDGHPLHFVKQIQDITTRREGERQTKASLAEKEVLLREIHHRVKNNMQVISSLLELHAAGLRDPADVEIFKGCQMRIHAMALVHDRLYRANSLATIDFGAHLVDLAALIGRSQCKTGRRIVLTTDCESVELNLDTALPLGLIATELVSNAYKHAFRDREKGRIGVAWKSLPDCKVALRVTDDGAGFPGGIEPAKTNSLGLRLVRMLVRQIRGELRFSNGNLNSIEIILTINGDKG
ncbi:MAG: PAS domain S-box protein [Verrucomicrobia bacterium]|nr:PAS domain S-box protein [Verrucomicrobiota bacterium]